MARRTIDFLVRVSVDEDAMRAKEDEHPAAWHGLIATLSVALRTIAQDNIDDGYAGNPSLDGEVTVEYGRTGIEYGTRGHDDEQVD